MCLASHMTPREPFTHSSLYSLLCRAAVWRGGQVRVGAHERGRVVVLIREFMRRFAPPIQSHQATRAA